LIFLCKHVSAQIGCDFAEMFKGGFEIFDDFLGENVGVGKAVRFFEAFVSQQRDVEAGLVALDELFMLVLAAANISSRRKSRML